MGDDTINLMQEEGPTHGAWRKSYDATRLKCNNTEIAEVRAKANYLRARATHLDSCADNLRVLADEPEWTA